MRGLVAVAVTLSLCAAMPACTAKTADQPETAALPWQITVEKDGALTVMGVTLGKTSATAAMRQFNAEPEIALFVDKEGVPSLEAYYGNVSAGGLTGTVIANLEVFGNWAADAKSRAAKSEKSANGDVKFTLSYVDYRASLPAKIEALTYLPSTHLDEEIVRSRFGAPDRTVEGAGGIRYWLYPASGAIVTLDPKGKESIQYVLPASFEAQAAKATGQ